jgi:hypothetical protein
VAPIGGVSAHGTGPLTRYDPLSLHSLIHSGLFQAALATTPEFREHPKVADAASELLVSVFGADKTSTRLVFGMASLPVGVCVVLESIFEIDN